MADVTDDEIEAIRARWTGDGPQAGRSGTEARDVRTLLAALDTARAEAQSERELAVAHAAYAQVYRARAETARREAIEEAWQAAHAAIAATWDRCCRDSDSQPRMQLYHVGEALDAAMRALLAGLDGPTEPE